MAFTISRPGKNGRRCNGDRISPLSVTASSAGWPSLARPRRSICIATPIARRCRCYAWSRNSVGVRASAARIRRPISTIGGRSLGKQCDIGLKQRIAVITRAGYGMRRASALLFAAEGPFVALVDRDSTGMAEATKAIRDANGDGSEHVGDVGDGDFAKATIAET